MNTKIKVLVLSLLVSCYVSRTVEAQDPSGERWWKGNLHTHSLWSDGDDFPEMITKWYFDHDYHFLALTDHNVLSEGERWKDLSTIEKLAGKTVLEKYIEAFGDDWVETRDKPSAAKPKTAETDQAGSAAPDKTAAETDAEKKPAPRQVRLRGLAEYRSKFESPGRFLMIQAEEISDRSQGVPVHMNATNLRTVISPLGGPTVRDAINNNLRAAEEQAAKNGEPILVHLNHPNFGWAVTAEDLAAVTNERFFEVYNGHPSVNQLGSETRASVEKIWDIANTIRIGELKSDPMFGLATDDCHHYHGDVPMDSRPGRGWVMVRSENLHPTALVDAMNEGKFYASSGVELASIDFDPEKKQLSVKINPQDGATYETRFIGTLKDYDQKSVARLDAEGKPIRTTRLYSDDVGKTLETSQSLEPSYQLTGDELFVRAVITSTRDHADPSFKGQKEQAWTQPVGWK